MKILSLLLLLFSVIYLFINLHKNWYKYQEKFDPIKYEKSYLASQWRVPNSKHVISDEELYTYSGYVLVKGENPILISPEVPPLGKYIIGLFVVTFGNGRFASLVFAILCLFLVTRIVFEATQSVLLASGALFLTSINSLFIDQIAFAPQLDIFHVTFFLLTAFFLFRYKKTSQKKFLLLAGISLGAMLSTKVFIHGFILMTSFLTIILYLKAHTVRIFLKEIFIITTMALIFFTLFYFSFFIHGGSFREFLGVQKWIVEFYRASQIDTKKLFGTYIFLVLFNKWKVWSEGYPVTSYQHWSIQWPVIFIAGIFFATKVLKIFKKATFEELFFSTWIILYGLSLAFVPVFPRYLLLLFIPIIILLTIHAKKAKVFH